MPLSNLPYRLWLPIRPRIFYKFTDLIYNCALNLIPASYFTKSSCLHYVHTARIHFRFHEARSAPLKNLFYSRNCSQTGTVYRLLIVLLLQIQLFPPPLKLICPVSCKQLLKSPASGILSVHWNMAC